MADLADGPSGLAQTIRVGECVQLGDDVRVWVAKVEGRAVVKLVIDAPRDVPVTRPVNLRRHDADPQ